MRGRREKGKREENGEKGDEEDKVRGNKEKGRGREEGKEGKEEEGKGSRRGKRKRREEEGSEGKVGATQFLPLKTEGKHTCMGILMQTYLQTGMNTHVHIHACVHMHSPSAFWLCIRFIAIRCSLDLIHLSSGPTY